MRQGHSKLGFEANADMTQWIRNNAGFIIQQTGYEEVLLKAKKDLLFDFKDDSIRYRCKKLKIEPIIEKKEEPKENTDQKQTYLSILHKRIYSIEASIKDLSKKVDAIHRMVAEIVGETDDLDPEKEKLDQDLFESIGA